MHNLYWYYPDSDTDVRAEQEVVGAAELIVPQFPIQQYAMPSLLREWIGVVLEVGWTCGSGGTALRGKYLMALTATGGRAHPYNADDIHDHTFDVFLPPLQRTAVLCGM